MDIERAREHLSLFVGKHSKWRQKGLPYRVYAPYRTNRLPSNYGHLLYAFGHGSTSSNGREISVTEALQRLQQGKPVRMQRMRLFRLLPDVTTIEQLALALVPPKARGLNKLVKRPQSGGTPYVQGWERRFGLPSTINSFAELKLFSHIYNQDLVLPPPLPTDSPTVLEQRGIVKGIGSLMTRTLDSGMYFYTYETRLAKRFVYHMMRKMMFWTPVAVTTIVFLASSPAFMGSVCGVEALPFLPWSGVEESTVAASSAAIDLDALPPDVQDAAAALKATHEILTNVETAIDPALRDSVKDLETSLLDTARDMGSLAVSLTAATTISFCRSAWQALFTHLGYQICSYEAFKLLARGKKIMLQERIMHSFRVPFTFSVTWFTDYRPGDSCSSAQELHDFCKLYLGKSEYEYDGEQPSPGAE